MVIHNKERLNNFYKHDKLNIALVTDIYYPSCGGVENVVKNLAKTFYKNKEVNIVVITGTAKDYKDNCEFPIIRVKSLKIPKKLGVSLPLPLFDRKFKKNLKKLNLDIIHIHTVYTLSTFMLKFAKKNNLPILLTGHSKFNLEIPTTISLPIIKKYLIKRAYKIANKTDMIIAVSNTTKKTYEEYNVKVPIKILGNATDFTLYEDSNKAFNYIKDKHNIDVDEKNILLCVCRLVINCKNLDFLLYSLKKLKEMKTTFKLLLVGSGPDENKIKQLIKKLQLEENIIMVGEIKDRETLKYYYLRSELFVFPSIIDNCAIVKFEAASQKTPTLAIENTGTSECIINNYNGYTSPLITEEYSKRIRKILFEKEKHQKVCENAYKTLSFTWDEISKNHIDLYKNLIKIKHKK